MWSVTLFSNRLEILFKELSQRLFNDSLPFANRLIIVPSLAMKSWLIGMLANHSGIACGITINLLNQALETFVKQEQQQRKIPSRIEIALACEIEIRKIIEAYPTFSAKEQEIWKTILDYLRSNTDSRSKKRLTALSDHLAMLFMQYDVYGYRMLEEWKNKKNESEWQSSLWCRLYENYPWIRFQEEMDPNKENLDVHVFGFSHLSALHHRLLDASKFSSIHYYQLSPCQLFWGDLQFDKEQKRWRKQRAHLMPSTAAQEIDLYLRDNNTLLANFGRIGREMTLLVEERQHITEEYYALPSTIVNIPHYKEAITPETMFYEKKSPFTLLDAVQADLSLLRNHRKGEKIPFDSYDRTIQIHVATSKMRETEILYNQLLNLIDRHSSESPQEPICPQDIIVMAPNINDYTPYIKRVFGGMESCLDFQIIDLTSQSQNSVIQAMQQLLNLGKGRWDSLSVLEIFDNPYFRKRHQLTESEIKQMQKWIREAEIHWGEDPMHRNEILHADHCLEGMADEHFSGTWQGGFERLIETLVIYEDKKYMHAQSVEGVAFSQAELLGTLLFLFRSLRKDLACLYNGTCMKLFEWVAYLKFLFNTYFCIDTQDHVAHSNYTALCMQIDQLDPMSSVSNELFSYPTIEHHLSALFNQGIANCRENHLHAVRFCSMLPMRAIPAKIICLLGMDEEAFPRSEKETSLDRLKEYPGTDYRPSSVDFDRYLFLEALLSTRNYLLISYVSLSNQMTEIPPSLLVTEFITYLDQAYTIQETAVSQFCLVVHPFYPFDHHYFQQDTNHSGSLLFNYSISDYYAAQAISNQESTAETKPKSYVISSPLITNPTIAEVIDVRQITSFAKNPLKAYCNATLGIYLKDDEGQEPRTEERFVLNSLENYQLRHEACKSSIDAAFSRAEKVSRLPMGAFKTVAKQHISREVLELKANIDALQIDFDSLITLEFSERYNKCVQINDLHWMVPAISWEDGSRKVTIVGTVDNIVAQGLILNGKSDVGDFSKAWPQMLLLCCAADQLPIVITKQFLPTKSNKPVAPIINDPKLLLKEYFNYYSMALLQPPLLIPEWLSDLLSCEPAPFIKKIHDKMNSHVKRFYNPYLDWLFPRGTKIGDEQQVIKWKQLAHHLYEGRF